MSHHQHGGRSHHGLNAHGSHSHGEGLSDREKLRKMIEHWIHHNEDHVQSYRQWAGQAEKLGETAVAETLEEAAAVSARMNALFEKALSRLDETS